MLEKRNIETTLPWVNDTDAGTTPIQWTISDSGRKMRSIIELRISIFALH